MTPEEARKRPLEERIEAAGRCVSRLMRTISLLEKQVEGLEERVHELEEERAGWERLSNFYETVRERGIAELRDRDETQRDRIDRLEREANTLRKTLEGTAARQKDNTCHATETDQNAAIR